MKSKRLVCVHLLNDYSGSPKVLHGLLQSILEEGENDTIVDLLTSKGGVLDMLVSSRLKTYVCRYRFSSNALITLFRFLWAQLYGFAWSLRYWRDRNCVFYINTLLPIGAAMAARLMHKPIIYHYHENAHAKGRLYQILCNLMQRIATDIICVSDYQRSFLSRKDRVHVVPNALPKSFVSHLEPNAKRSFSAKQVLMLASLKTYKGVHEYIELARRLSEFNFVMVLNEDEDVINRYFEGLGVELPSNLRIYPRQVETTKYYNSSSIVLNLSNPKMVVETFGLTALEAMSAGLPVIVPTVGGIAELVIEDKCGYHIDVQDLDAIEHRVRQILEDKALYVRLSQGAEDEAQRYSTSKMSSQISAIINKYS